MARVRLSVDDEPNRLRLRAALESAGHRVVENGADVFVTDHLGRAVGAANVLPSLVLVGALHVPDAVAAMRRGVYGYILVPLHPGEASLMVERAAGVFASDAGVVAPITLAEMEARHIVATLRRYKNNRAQAARALGIGRNTLWRKLKRIDEQL